MKVCQPDQQAEKLEDMLKKQTSKKARCSNQKRPCIGIAMCLMKKIHKITFGECDETENDQVFDDVAQEIQQENNVPFLGDTTTPVQINEQSENVDRLPWMQNS